MTAKASPKAWHEAGKAAVAVWCEAAVVCRERDPGVLAARLRQLSDGDGADIALQLRLCRWRPYGLAVFDMDSTLISCEVIDELARVV